MADRFLIAPLKSGLVTALPSWQIPEDAFSQLKNAYVFRGRVEKRSGAELMGSGASSSSGTAPLNSRLRTNLGAYAPGAVATPINVAVGQQFSVGDTILTVKDATIAAALLTTGAITATVTGAAQVTFVGAGVGNLFFYPGLPVMGITNYEVGTINNQPTIAFDTRFAYQFVTSAWTRIDPLVSWTGNDQNYFWSYNSQGTASYDTFLFTTNFNAPVNAAPGGDPIRYWDGTSWTNFTTPNTVFIADGSFVATARIIVTFKNRLVFLNTIETIDPGGTNMNRAFPWRARWSAPGSPLATGAFLEPNQTFMGTNWSGGGFRDAPTQEEIVSAEFIKDRLIVYFEQSTWELAWTGNNASPFVWQQLNTELGAMSTFSIIPFDKAVLAIGNTGVNSCNGSNVERIDDVIPQTIFQISKKSNGALRVCGIRDYYSEVVYWSYPSVDIDTLNTRRFPDKMLVYNYANSTWSIWDDTFTAYGYFYQQIDVTWADMLDEWQSYDVAWDAGVQFQQQRRVIAGNQQGYVVAFNRAIFNNAQAYTITDVLFVGAILTLKVINHSMEAGDFVEIRNLNGVAGFVPVIVPIRIVVGADTFNVLIEGLSGTYTGGGTLTRVSRVDILSKQWNPYISKGRSVYLSLIDFCVRRTVDSEITVDYYSSSSQLSNVTNGQATGSILGTSILETRPYPIVPFEEVQSILWHRVYFQSTGQFIQIRMYWTDDQMRNPDISQDEFTLEGLILGTQPTSYTLDT